jgi:hypothetical protein
MQITGIFRFEIYNCKSATLETHFPNVTSIGICDNCKISNKVRPSFHSQEWIRTWIPVILKSCNKYSEILRKIRS